MKVQPKELCDMFRANLKTRRVELGLSQSEIARRIGVDPGYISDLERGKRNPNLQRLAPLAVALDTTPSALLSVALPVV